MIPIQLPAQLKLMVNIDDKKILSELKAISIRMNADTSDFRTKITERIKLSFNKDTLTSSDSLRINIVRKAFDYIGVRYRYGQSSEKGFDCSGYVKYVFLKFGIDLPHSSYEQYKISRHIKQEEAKAGDLVFFNTRGGISHVGIYLGENQFIHSPRTGYTVSVSSLRSGYFKNHLIGFGSVLKSEQ